MAETKTDTRVSALADLNETELAALKALAGEPRVARRNEVIRHQGDAGPIAYFLYEGWVASCQNLPDGARQLLKINIPGDMMGTPSLPLARAADTLMALTAIRYAPVHLHKMGALFADHPRIGMVFFLIAQEERVVLGDRLASLGRQSARERVLAFLLHLADRSGNAESGGVVAFDFPLTQEQIGDFLGLTAVHVNRVLRGLSVDELIRIERPRIRLIGLDRLRAELRLPERRVVRNLDWLPPARGEPDFEPRRANDV